MTVTVEAELPPPELLLAVIQTQTDIAKLGLDLGGLMDMVVDRTQAIIGADGAVVELAEGDDMVYRAVAGMAKPQLGLRLARDGSLSGTCVNEARSMQCDDSETDPRVNRDACRRVGLRSMLIVPLRHSDTVVGVLKVMSKAPYAFKPTDARVLSLMSDLIGAAMYFATRYEASELFQRATQDGLTGVANRALFYDRLRHCIAQAKRGNYRVGVCVLDMDGLKQINDAYGHRTGDAALCELASRVVQAARASDMTARLGGDEFGVILSSVDDVSGVERACARFAVSIAQPFTFEQSALVLSASIGSAIYPDDGETIDALMETADQAMYEVKRSRASR